MLELTARVAKEVHSIPRPCQDQLQSPPPEMDKVHDVVSMALEPPCLLPPRSSRHEEQTAHGHAIRLLKLVKVMLSHSIQQTCILLLAGRERTEPVH